MEWRESSYSQETAFRLARAGAWVRIVAVGDACEVCRALAGRIYPPSEVPRLPVRGCMRDSCRCRFVAVDPETKLTVPQLTQQGIQALKAGDKGLARDTLRKAVTLDELYEPGWLWLSGVVDTQEQVACLEKVLELNPRHRRARAGLELLRTRSKATEPPAAVEEEPSAPPEPAAEEPQDQEPEPELPAPEGDAPPIGPSEPEPSTEQARRDLSTRPLRRDALPESERVEPIVSPEEAQASDPAGEEQLTETPALPPQVIEGRVERKVIVEQWVDFMSISIETDSQMLLMQGQAFLRMLAEIDEQVLELLHPEAHLDELLLQWQDSESMGEALADALDLHKSRYSDSPEWREMHRAVGSLAQQLLEHRNDLRARIAAAGGQIPER